MPVMGPQVTAPPTVDQVAARLGRTVDQVSDAYAAESADQASRCRTSPYSNALGEALHRRVQRNLAMRSLPLGVQMDDSGGMVIGSRDPEVRRLEAPYRRLVMA